jgi:tetratricopeptide (TPR) repeat protein
MKIDDVMHHVRPRVVFGAAIALVLVTAALLIARRSPPLPPSEPLYEELAGEGSIFNADSELTFRVRQPTPLGGVPMLDLSAFEVVADEQLVWIAVRKSRRENTEQIEMELVVRISDAFPLAEGKKQIVFVVSGPGGDPKRFAERTLGELMGREELRCFQREIELRRPELGAELLKMDRFETDAGKIIPVYTSSKLPRVLLQTTATDRFELRLRGPADSAVPLETSKRQRDADAVLEVAHFLGDSMRGDTRLELLRDGDVHATWPIRWAPAPDDYPVFAKAKAETSSVAKISALVKLRERGGWEEFQAEAEIGRVHDKAGDAEQAWESWDRARVIAERLGSPSEVAGRLRSLAFLDIQAGKYTRAREEIDRARSLSASVGDIAGLTRAQYYDALLLERQGGPASALLAMKRYLEAINTARHYENGTDAALFALLLASVLAEQGSLEEARAWVNDASSQPERTRLWLDFIIHRAHVERVALERGENTADLARLHRELLRDLNTLVDHPEARPSHRASLLADLIRFDLAANDLELAEAHLAALNDSAAKDTGLLRMLHPLLTAELDLVRGRTEKAITDLRAFQETIADSGGDFSLEARDAAEALIGEAHLAAGRASDAELSFRRAIESRDERARSLESLRARERYRVQFARAERHLIALLIKDRAEEAFELAEWIRARNLLELAKHARIAESAELFDRYTQAYSDLHVRYPTSCAVASAAEEKDCRAIRAAVDIAQEELTLALGADLVQPSLDRFRPLSILKTLPDSDAVLSLVPLDRERTVSFFVRAGRVRFQMAAKGEDPVAPWLPELSALRRLYVAPNHPAAFELPFRRIDGRVLGGKLPILMLVYGDQTQVRARRGGALIVADPDRTLWHADKEGKELKRFLPDALLLQGEAATRARVRAAWDVEVLHFAGHAAMIAGDIARSTLQLAGDDVISRDDVLAWPPRAGLVVLAACESGVYEGRGTIGLPEAFGRAADYVLASGARVLDDADAHAFVSSFYAHGLKDPPEAYRRALAEASDRELRTGFRLWASVRSSRP